MEKLVIEGGHKLEGTVRVSGSKNSSLPILFASLLCNGEVKLKNIPFLRDINTSLQLLRTLGAEAEREGEYVKIKTEADRLLAEAPYDLVRTMRASVLCLGPLLARIGKARVALPGGCAIGARPVDQHLKALEKMGASFELEEGYISGSCNRLHGARIAFDMATVGGTENIMMAAAMAEGETILENAAREPEIVDLANFLNSCGACIEGQGESVIRIQGRDFLEGTEYTVMPDRIEAGTFLIAAGISSGNLLIENCPLEALDAVVDKLRQMGMEIDRDETGLVHARAGDRLQAVDITTRPYPGFPTDMQAQIMALLCFSSGAAVVEESIFENRFMHVQELLRMGANIRISGRSAMVKGQGKLSGAPVMASDLRASASLVLAGLAADGITEVARIYHLDRGYESIEKKLNAAGANIRREKMATEV